MQTYRPVVLLGQGIRSYPSLISKLQSLGVPCLYTWMAADMGVEDDPTFCGRPGIFGQRAANIIQQKATHLYCYGARLDGEQVAYDYDRFAPNAKIFIFDIDGFERDKFPSRYQRMTLYQTPEQSDPEWLIWCRALYTRFRPELNGKDLPKFVDPFRLMTLLHEYTNEDDVFALGSSGNAPTAFFQSYKVKQGQRVSNVSTIGAMGADVPMALGVALATHKRVICITGDGGFNMNAQELEVIRRLHLPIIFFVLNNNGYNSIRVAQQARFGRVTGADPATGLTLPDIERIAEAYRFMYHPLKAGNLQYFSKCFTATPIIVEVFVDPEWQQFPRVMASTVNGELRTDDMQDMTLKIDDIAELMK